MLDEFLRGLEPVEQIEVGDAAAELAFDEARPESVRNYAELTRELLAEAAQDDLLYRQRWWSGNDDD